MDLDQLFSNSQRAALVLRAINNPVRKKMLKLFLEENPMTVTEVYIKLRLEQSIASQHLAILRRASLVKTHREGKNISYWANVENIKKVTQLVEQLADFNVPLIRK